MKIEILPLVVNICCTGYYLYQWDEPGKIIYWLGACLLTVGLLLMRG